MLFSLLSRRTFDLAETRAGLETCLYVCPRTCEINPFEVSSCYRFSCATLWLFVDRLTLASAGWAMRGQAVRLGSKKTLCFICVQFLKRICETTSVLFTRDTGRKTYLRRIGLPYARENIINQTATATSRATQSLTKKSLLTAPYYHSLSCDMNIIDENSLNVVFSPGILYCAFENHAISRKWNRISAPLPLVFINANFPLHLYPISYYRVVLFFRVVIFYTGKEIIWEIV